MRALFWQYVALLKTYTGCPFILGHSFKAALSRYPFCSAAVLWLILLEPHTASAQLGIAEIALGGATVDKLLQDFEQAGHNLLAHGEETGNALISKLGDEVELATANLSVIMDDQRTKLFDSLTIAEQQPFIELNNTLRTANDATTRVVDMVELRVLDLNYLAGPLLAAHLDFYVNSVQGLTQFSQDAPFRVKVRGLGFAYDDSHATYDIAVICNGDSVPAASLTRSNAHELTIDIPNPMLAPHFKDNTLVYVPVTLRSTIKKWWWRRPATYEATFKLILLPITAGEIEIQQVVLGPLVLSPTVQTHDIVDVTSEALNGHKAPFDIHDEWTVASNQRIVGVRYECPAGNLPNPGGIAGFTSNLRRLHGAGPYDPDYDLLDDNRRVEVYRRCGYGGTTTVIHHIDYKTYEPTYIKKSTTRKISFGIPTEIDRDPKNADGNWEIHGKLKTGQIISLNRDSAASTNGPLRIEGSGKVGDHVHLTFGLVVP